VRGGGLGARLRRRFLTIGRVPFGRHTRGVLRLRRNLRVNGRKLGRGRYLITLRALNRRNQVIARADPMTLTIG
jgi:hypothetical protein